MLESWECKNCHNVYAPNIPFCLYCWFKNSNNIPSINSITTPITQEKSVEVTVEKNQTSIPITNDTQEQDKVISYITSRSITRDQTLTKKSISDNKNLIIDKVDIDIPPLNKIPNVPLADKWPDTKIYLSGMAHSKERAIARTFKIPYMLDSIIDLPIVPSKLVRKYFDRIKSNDTQYMLDSGAFSYMMNPKKSLDLNAHLKQYCYYINEFDIQDFFELDLDVFMSIDEIENVRKKIYLETHKRPIIVYHIERGHDYWINMCKDNEFVAIGGMASAKAKEERWDFERATEMCDEAHSYGTLVHGLGCTPLAILNAHKMCFDTVDSTTWNATMRGQSMALNEKGELIRIPPIDVFSAMEAQEEDLRAWATFAANYKGGIRT